MKNSMHCALAIGLFAMAGSVRAGEDAWSFKVTPYLWAAGIQGDVGAEELTVPVDVSFVDALADLDFFFMVSAEATYGKWSFLADGAYLSLSDDDIETAWGDAEVDFEQWLLQGTALYLVYAEKQTSVDVGAGLRYFSADTTINVPSSRSDLNPSDGWTDLVLAGRVRQQFTDKIFGMFYGDLGGFGLASDLTWQFMLGGGYALTEQVAVLAVYRYLSYDYSNNGFEYDASNDGFAVGLQFNF